MIFVFLLIGLIILVIRATAPSRNVASADEAFKSGHIRKAEEYLKKVWTRRDDIPAHLAGMHFELIKKGKLSYVKEALSISQEGLSENAKYQLKGVQKDIQKYIKDKASAAFLTEDYTEAIKYNETLIPFGREFKDKDEEYRVYRELKNYLTSGRKGSALNIYLSDTLSLVVRCIISRVRELDSPIDALKLLSLALTSAEIKSEFESRVLKYVLEYDRLPELKADADKYQQVYLEGQADKMPETKILEALRIYKALNFKKPSVSISEKIESLNYKRACSFIKKDDYKGFRLLQSALKQNMDVTPGFRYDLGCKYNILLFDYLSKILLSEGLKGEKWEDFLRCCTEYAATEKTEDVLKLAIALNTKGSFVESGKLCRLLNNSNPNVFDLVCSNVISLLELSSKYECLAEVYDKVEALPKVAERCFEHASKLVAEGDYAKAVYIEKLAEPYFSGDSNKYDTFITHYLTYAMSFTKAQLPSEIDSIMAYLNKVTDKTIVNKHLAAMEDMASHILSRGKAAEAYEITKRILENSKQAARIFLDSALALAQKGQLKDSFGLSKALGMQEDILGETLKFIPYFAQELRVPYVTGYSRRVVELFKSNQEEAINFYRAQEDISLRNDILEEVSRIDTSAFKAIAIDILKETDTRLPKGSAYASTVIRLISDIFTGEDKVVLLKYLAEKGYDANEHYVIAVISSIDQEDLLEMKLAKVDAALSVVEDSRLYAAKKDIAKAYVTEDPLKSLAICAEIRSKVTVKDIEFDCHIKIAETTDSLTEKHSHLRSAKELCGNNSKVKYAKVITLALDLAKSLFVSGKTDEAHSVCTEFPSLETELLSIGYKLEDAKKISGDATAAKELKELINLCDSSTNAEGIYNSTTYKDIWHEYTRRNLSKASKQSADKAISTLIATAAEVDEANFDASDLYKNLADQISQLSYDLAYESEENADYENAIKYYEISVEYDPTRNLADGRRILCLLKQGTTGVVELKKEIDQVLGTVPRNIEKDIVYRYVLRALQEGHVVEATKLAEEKLRDNKLLDLCETYRLRMVQSQINDFNEQLALIRDKKMNYTDAKALHSGLDERLNQIVSVFPEYRHLVSEYKKAIFGYMLKMAQKEEKYDILYAHYRSGSGDFMKDKTRFRNLAAVCIGMIEQGYLNESNYQEVISIWLTAVYNDYLIVRSLDHTKWDDGYTFTLDDSLSQTYGYDNLPDNINYDSPDESNVSIGHVQKSLLERSDAALSNGEKKYYDFYLEQIKAMKAYSEVKYKELDLDDTEENIIAPYALIHILPVEYANKMKASLNTGNKEHGYRVGYLYGFTDSVFADYDAAVKKYEACISAAEKLTHVGTSFTAAKLSSIRKFGNLYNQLVSEVTSILDKHINDEKSYSHLLSPYCAICKAMKDDTLSYKFSEYINSQIIPLVNDDSMTTAEGLDVLYQVYTVYSQNVTIKKNVSGMLNRVIQDYIMEDSTAGWTAITRVLNDTNDFNNDVLDVLCQEGLAIAVMLTGKQARLNSVLDLIKGNDPSAEAKVNKVQTAMQTAKLQKELGDIIDKVNNDTMTGLTALQKIYAIYKQAKSDSRICENMAIIANRCIHEYIPSNKTGVTSVRNILDELYANRSYTFNTKRHIFRDAISEIRSGMTTEQQALLGLIDSPFAGIYTSGQVLNANGERLKLAISYLKKFAND